MSLFFPTACVVNLPLAKRDLAHEAVYVAARDPLFFADTDYVSMVSRGHRATVVVFGVVEDDDDATIVRLERRAKFRLAREGKTWCVVSGHILPDVMKVLRSIP